jgi:hypothetical protein
MPVVAVPDFDAWCYAASSMWVLNVVVGARPSRFAWCVAVLATSVLSLGGCGRERSRPQPSAPANTGGSAASGGNAAGEGGSEEGAAAGFAGSSGVSDGGRGLGGAASGGLGGGSSGAGTASGGAGAGAGGRVVQGGAGGRSPLADLPLPAGCQALSGGATELLCSLDVSCNAVAQTMSCYHRGSDAMQCSCEAPNSDKMYVIEGATGLDACAIGAGLCAGAAPDPGFDLGDCATTGEETGDEEPSVGDPNSCTVELNCQRTVVVDFAPGVRVTMPGSARTHCVESSSGDRISEQRRVDCETTGSLGTESHALIANSVAEACRPVLDFYLSSLEPDFDGTQSCVVEGNPNGGSDSCMLTETCFDSAPISDGVSLVRYLPLERAASCHFDDLGNLSCGCRFQNAVGHTDYISYDLGVVAPPATCDLSDCTLDMRADATGPGTCQAQLYSLEYDDDSCTDYFVCRQPATLAGVDVTISSQLNVRCARGADDAFYCGCGTGHETATYRAGEVARSMDACAMARTDCLTHLTLPLAPASVEPAPDPLLGL